MEITNPHILDLIHFTGVMTLTLMAICLIYGTIASLWEWHIEAKLRRKYKRQTHTRDL